MMKLQIDHMIITDIDELVRLLEHERFDCSVLITAPDWMTHIDEQKKAADRIIEIDKMVNSLHYDYGDCYDDRIG